MGTDACINKNSLKCKRVSWIQYQKRRTSRMNGWRIALVLLGIMFVFWVILSVLLSTYMTSEWQNEWWQIVMALTGLWLYYVLIVYLVHYFSS